MLKKCVAQNWFRIFNGGDTSLKDKLKSGRSSVLEDEALLEMVEKQPSTNTHHHHHHVVPPAWISLILSRHFSLSFIASGWSSRLHPISSHSCCMYVLAGRPALAWPYVGVHREYIFYELVPAPPAVSCVPGSSNYKHTYIVGKTWSFTKHHQLTPYISLPLGTDAELLKILQYFCGDKGGNYIISLTYWERIVPLLFR